MKYRKVNVTLLEDILLDKQERVSEATLRVGRTLIALLKKFLGDDYAKHVLTPEDCQAFAQYLGKTRKPSSCRTYLQHLSTLMLEAEDKGLIASSPMRHVQRVDMPKRSTPDVVYLTKKELQRLTVANCLNDSTRQAFLFSCFTGLMLADIQSLQWHNIQLIDDQWTLVKTMNRSGAALQIPLVSSSLNILQEIKKQQSEQSEISENGNVFHMLSPTSISRDLVRWAKAANLDKPLTFFVGRHTFGTLSISAGIDIYTLSKWMGHSTIESTKLYYDLIHNNQKSDIDSLEAILTL